MTVGTTFLVKSIEQGWHATNDASLISSNGGFGGGGSGSNNCGGESGGDDIVAKGPQGIWMQYYPLWRLNSSLGDDGGGCG